MARLLTECGAPCGHERTYRIQNRDGAVVTRNEASGDSSCFAGALLPIPGVVAVHVIRPPLDVVASLLGRGLLSEKRHLMWQFIRRYAPQVAGHPPGAARAAAWWLAWNAHIAPHADLTWRLHTLNPADVMALSDTCGLDLEPHRVADAFAAVPCDINAHQHRMVNLSELGELARPVIDAAAEYGVPLTTRLETARG